MAIYEIGKRGNVLPLDRVSTKEEFVHRLFEQNLSELLEMRVIGHKYKVDNLDNNRDEIDTLAVDGSNRPVIIEYKQGQAPDDVIAQIQAYKFHLKKDRKSVDRDAKDKYNVTLDWSAGIQTYLVAEGFSKDIRANAAAGNLTLIRYSLHKRGTALILSIESNGKIEKKKRTRRGETSSDEGSPSTISQVESDGIQRYLETTKSEFSVPFRNLRAQIKGLDGIEEVIQPKIGITYKTLKAVARFEFRKNSIDVLLKSGAVQADNEKHLKDIIDHKWGFPWLFKIESANDFDYAFRLIKSAYDALR